MNIQESPVGGSDGVKRERKESTGRREGKRKEKYEVKNEGEKDGRIKEWEEPREQ